MHATTLFYTYVCSPDTAMFYRFVTAAPPPFFMPLSRPLCPSQHIMCWQNKHIIWAIPCWCSTPPAPSPSFATLAPLSFSYYRFVYSTTTTNIAYTYGAARLHPSSCVVGMAFYAVLLYDYTFFQSPTAAAYYSFLSSRTTSYVPTSVESAVSVIYVGRH